MDKVNEAEKICIEILNWSERSVRAENFNTEFVESVLGQVYERNSVTDRQIEAVVNIKDRFEITTLDGSLYEDLKDRFRAKYGKVTVASKVQGFM